MYTFIFDIGKTNVKGFVLDHTGQSVWSSSTRNIPQTDGDYPSFDVDNTWSWLQDTLKRAAASFSITAINVSTHGACAVLLDEKGELLLPVMDYEVESLECDDANYSSIRPSYEETQSPSLSGGLNLGRQLWWLQQNYSERFSALKQILFYPQYWVWKLTGKAVAETTSLGCHTDLWQPNEALYSSLADNLNIREALPPIVSCIEAVGPVKSELAKTLGLPDDCMVYPGVHDSNSGLARYLASDLEAPFNVISTGTWVVSMAVGGDSATLKDELDMLANVDVRGEPVPCARFMGGREFELLCELTKVADDEEITREAIEDIIRSNVFALPPFDEGSGPFRYSNEKGQIIGPVRHGKTLATLYLLMMIDYELELLASEGEILFGSASQKNPLLCQMLAQLRPNQAVLLSNDTTSTVKGAWCLTRWNEQMPASFSEFQKAPASAIDGLEDYKAAWRSKAQNLLKNAI